TRRQKMVHEIPLPGTANLAFSPDGRWLVSGTIGEYGFWHAGTWEPGPKIPRDSDAEGPGVMAFARDGKLLALAVSPARVQLMDTTTLRRIALLEPPEPKRLSWLCFSGDSTQLAAATESHLIHVWNLRRLREQLAARGLDWELQSYPKLTEFAEVQP